MYKIEIFAPQRRWRAAAYARKAVLAIGIKQALVIEAIAVAGDNIERYAEAVYIGAILVRSAS
jgi:hypothetical protein